MRFIKTKFDTAYLIEMEEKRDSRGFFARSFCAKEFEDYNLSNSFVQQNTSYNLKKGTIRGMHFQKKPHEETKLIRCIQGEIYDVILDLRKESPTFMQWEAFILNNTNRNMLYIPKGFAHGYQTLADDSEVLYLVDEYYNPSFEAGLRYDDQRFSIAWPIREDIIISEKDLFHEFLM